VCTTELSKIVIKKLNSLNIKERNVIINYVWAYYILGSITSKSAENSIIKEIESIEENQRIKIIQHVYLNWLKPILVQADLIDAWHGEDNIYDVYVNYVDNERYSTSVLTKLISDLEKIVLEFEMSDDEDVIEERRFQAGVTLELIKTLLNGNPIARYDSEKQQAYLLFRDGTKNYNQL
jgi:hypothetical protein